MHALDKAIVVGESAINFRKRSRWKHYVCMRSCLCFKKLLHDEKIEIAQRAFTFGGTLRQKAPTYVHSGTRFDHFLGKLVCVLSGRHHIGTAVADVASGE